MRVRFNYWCSAKEIRITYSECVFVTLVNLRVKRIRHIICGLPRATTFFHIIWQTNDTIFEKRKFSNMKCVFDFHHTFSEKKSHSEKNWVRYDKKIYICLQVKYPLFLLDFNETWIFSIDFRKIFEYQIL